MVKKRSNAKRGRGVAAIMPIHSRMEMNGTGFWDDVGNGFKSAGNFFVDKVLPKVVDVGLPLLAKAAMGAGKRGRGKQTPRIIDLVIKA